MQSDEEAESVESSIGEATDVTDVGPIPSAEGLDAADEAKFERRWSKRSTPKAATEVGPEQTLPSTGSEDLQKEKARADELHDRLQRSMADLSNYRKRAEAERQEREKLAGMLLIAELLPVLDNFERALDSIPRELQFFSWIQGIALVERHLRAILDRQGIQPIEALGSDFNPNYHEAIVEEETSEAKPGTIVGELQRGYTMHGHVLRPTLAKVAKAPSSDSDATTHTSQTIVESDVEAEKA